MERETASSRVEDQSAVGRLRDALANCPLIAILRGLTPADAPAVGAALHAAGFRVIEVPLNSPEPLESIRLLAESLPDCLVGAGTVLRVDQIEPIGRAGGRLIVMPHADVHVIAAAKAASMACMPGVATPTEAFAALAAGADGLKLFPAELIRPPVIRAMRAVLPRETCLAPVGGLTPDNLAEYRRAGADAFGLGSALYRPGATADEVARNAAAFVRALSDA